MALGKNEFIPFGALSYWQKGSFRCLTPPKLAKGLRHLKSLARYY
jgi:hypothetical protein